MEQKTPRLLAVKRKRWHLYLGTGFLFKWLFVERSLLAEYLSG